MTTWGKVKRLADVAEIYSGNSVSESEKKKLFTGVPNGMPYIGTKDVGFDGEIDYENGVLIPDANRQSFKVAPSDSVLVCAEGGSAGRKIGLLDRDVCFGNKLYAIRPREEIQSRYLYYYCQSSAFKDQFKAAMTGLIGGVSQGKFKEITIPVPTLEIQSRIVEKLDSLSEKIDAGVDMATRNLDRLNQLFEGVLEKTLYVDHEDWTESQLASLCEEHRQITYGVIKLGDEVPNGVPCLRTSNVRWLSFDLDGMKRIDPSLSGEYSRTILKGGEVLVNVRGTLGGVAVVSDEMIGWNVSREVAVVPVDQAKICSEYVSYFIGTSSSQDWLGGVKKGAAYVGINLEDLRLLKVKHPSFDEQKNISEKLGKIQALIESVRNVYERQISNYEELRLSLFHKAFTGSLI